MFAEYHKINVTRVRTQVSLNKDRPDSALFEYKIEFDGDLTETEKEKLKQAASSCPVKKTLSRRIDFKFIE
jgi:putative redox protein